MANPRDSFCSFCGQAFSDTATYPRACSKCGAQIWANPIPVSVVLVPVRSEGRVGLLVVRRAIEPKKGLLAIVGGFLEEHERWQEGGAREVREETDVVIDPSGLVPFWFTSTEPRPNRVLLFSIAREIDARAMPPFTVTPETSERGLVFGPEGLDEVFAFPLHAEAARRFFASREITGPHGYTRSE
jgi:ADP-ribose pyrophosphatase YjhB (NUDIX family)